MEVMLFLLHGDIKLIKEEATETKLTLKDSVGNKIVCVGLYQSSGILLSTPLFMCPKIASEAIALSAISQTSGKPALSPKNEGVALLKSEYGIFCLRRRLSIATLMKVKEPATRWRIIFKSHLVGDKYLMTYFF